MCSERVSSSCSISGTRRVAFVINPVNSHERGQDRIVITTRRTYRWSFVTDVSQWLTKLSWRPKNFRSDDFNLSTGNPWFSSFLVSSNSLSRKSWLLIGTTRSGISLQQRDIYSICSCCWNVATYRWKVHNRNMEIISFIVKFRS